MHLATCPCCGLAQTVPNVPAGRRACCRRCRTTVSRGAVRAGSHHVTAAIALAGLILYPLAVALPIIEIEKFGHRHEASILDGVSSLLAGGHLVVGVIVLLCSIVLPLGKLLSLLVLTAGGLFMRVRHRAFVYRLVELTGRWGMLDVLLVAVLVAVLKLGDLVTVTPGPAAVAFTCCVVLSLLATATFDPHRMWAPNA